ncbi:dnaJ homolog subfamily C member 13-like [Macrobrachium nipponense]|uniref:dnaJ homolog subfamily C member 13-like n=1 Tax=Macrobrachium nipponense TaxID=159736 RepID=UPI0030C86003
MGTNNQDVACYLVTKHSAWKGKYKRIFSVGNAGITTYNPNSMEVTNQWYYHDFINITPALKGIGQVPNEFIITMRKGKKVDHMRFSSDHRTDIISEALVYRHSFAEPVSDNLRANAQKVHWTETKQSVVLEVTPCSVDQLDPTTGAPLTSYMFKDIEALVPISDLPGGICIQTMEQLGVSVKVVMDKAKNDSVVFSGGGGYCNGELLKGLSLHVYRLSSSEDSSPRRQWRLGNKSQPLKRGASDTAQAPVVPKNSRDPCPSCSHWESPECFSSYCLSKVDTSPAHRALHCSLAPHQAPVSVLCNTLPAVTERSVDLPSDAI